MIQQQAAKNIISDFRLPILAIESVDRAKDPAATLFAANTVASPEVVWRDRASWDERRGGKRSHELSLIARRRVGACARQPFRALIVFGVADVVRA